MVSASVIEAIHRLDQDITLIVNSWGDSWSEGFWMMMSDKMFWIPAYVICAYFLFERLGWKKAIIVLASAALAFGLCDQFSNIVKHAVSRLRPSYSYRMLEGGLNVLEKRGGYFGFFSAHAANAFAVAMCMIHGFRNDKAHTYNSFSVLALVWALLVSVSRVFVGKHYLGDVFVGAILGMLIGYFVGRLSRFIIGKALPFKVQAGQSPS